MHANCVSCHRFVPCETTVNGLWICAPCRAAYCHDVPGGFCHRAHAVCTEDTGEWECTNRTSERGWYQVPDGGWYSSRATAPLMPLDYHTNVLEQCTSAHDLSKSKELLMGVELEMEARNPEVEAQNEIVKRLNGPVAEKYICTHDGSLDYGVEIVTLPYTLEEHKTTFGWKRVLAPVVHIAKSGSHTKHCGMHVHLNRRALTPLQLGKMLVFLNADETDELVSLIAQRRTNGFSQKKEIRSPTDVNMDECDISRYERLNVRPRHTVEFRIFKGNLRYERVLKNLEFVHATVNFCKDASIQDLKKPTVFIEYLKKHRGMYPYLLRFLQEHRFMNYEGSAQCAKLFAPNRRTHKAAAPVLEEV